MLQTTSMDDDPEDSVASNSFYASLSALPQQQNELEDLGEFLSHLESRLKDAASPPKPAPKQFDPEIDAGELELADDFLHAEEGEKIDKSDEDDETELQEEKEKEKESKETEKQTENASVVRLYQAMYDDGRRRLPNQVPDYSLTGFDGVIADDYKNMFNALTGTHLNKVSTRLQSLWRTKQKRNIFVKWKSNQFTRLQLHFKGWRSVTVAKLFFNRLLCRWIWQGWKQVVLDQKRIHMVRWKVFGGRMGQKSLAITAVNLFFAPGVVPPDAISANALKLGVRRQILLFLLNAWRNEVKDWQRCRSGAVMMLQRALRRNKAGKCHWTPELIGLVFHMWRRSFAYKRAFKNKSKLPHFNRPDLPEWSDWVRRYMTKQLLKQRASKMGLRVFQRNKLRRWRWYTRYMKGMAGRLKTADNFYKDRLLGLILTTWLRYTRCRGRVFRRRIEYFRAWKHWAPKKKRLRQLKELLTLKATRNVAKRAMRCWSSCLNNIRLMHSFRLRRITDTEVFYPVMSVAYVLNNCFPNYYVLWCFRRWQLFRTRCIAWKSFYFLHQRESARQLIKTIFQAWRSITLKFIASGQQIVLEPFLSMERIQMLADLVKKGLRPERVLDLPSSGIKLLPGHRAKLAISSSRDDCGGDGYLHRSNDDDDGEEELLYSKPRALVTEMESALMKSIGECDENSLMDILEKGARVDFVYGEDGRTPLHHACSYFSEKYLKMVSLLLHCGGDVNRKDSNGLKPIDLASNPQVVMLLYEHSARLKHSPTHKEMTRCMVLMTKKWDQLGAKSLWRFALCELARVRTTHVQSKPDPKTKESSAPIVKDLVAIGIAKRRDRRLMNAMHYVENTHKSHVFSLDDPDIALLTSHVPVPVIRERTSSLDLSPIEDPDPIIARRRQALRWLSNWSQKQEDRTLHFIADELIHIRGDNIIAKREKLESIAWRALAACEIQQKEKGRILQDSLHTRLVRDLGLLSAQLHREISKDFNTLNPVSSLISNSRLSVGGGSENRSGLGGGGENRSGLGAGPISASVSSATSINSSTNEVGSAAAAAMKTPSYLENSQSLLIEVVSDGLPQVIHDSVIEFRQIRTNRQIPLICEALRNAIFPIPYLRSCAEGTLPGIEYNELDVDDLDDEYSVDTPKATGGSGGMTEPGDFGSISFESGSVVSRRKRKRGIGQGIGGEEAKNPVRFAALLRKEKDFLQQKKQEVHVDAQKHYKEVQVLHECLQALSQNDRVTETSVLVGADDMKELDSELFAARKKTRSGVLGRDRELLSKRRQVSELESEIELAYNAIEEKSKAQNERSRRYGGFDNDKEIGGKPLPSVNWPEDQLQEYVKSHLVSIKSGKETIGMLERRAELAKEALLNLITEKEHEKVVLRKNNVLQLVVMDDLRDSRRAIETKLKATDKKMKQLKAWHEQISIDLKEVRMALAALGDADLDVTEGYGSPLYLPDSSGAINFDHMDFYNSESTSGSSSSSSVTNSPRSSSSKGASQPLSALNDGNGVGSGDDGAAIGESGVVPSGHAAEGHHPHHRHGDHGPEHNGEHAANKSTHHSSHHHHHANSGHHAHGSHHHHHHGHHHGHHGHHHGHHGHHHGHHGHHKVSPLKPGLKGSDESVPSTGSSRSNSFDSQGMNIHRRDGMMGKKDFHMIDAAFVESLEVDPIKTPRLDVDNSEKIPFEQEIIDRYQEALGTLFPDERIKLVDLKKDVMKQNATSEAEKLELQREFGYDGGEEARGEVPAELPVEDTIVSTGKLRRDWDRIGQSNKKAAAADSLSSPGSSSVTAGSNVKKKDDDFYEDDENKNGALNKAPHGPQELTFSFGNFGVCENEAFGENARVAVPPSELSEHNVDDFHASISMTGDDPPPVNDVEALILEEMTAEEKIARRLKTEDDFLDMNDEQLELFDEAEYIRKEKPVVNASPTRRSRRSRHPRTSSKPSTPSVKQPSSPPSSPPIPAVKESPTVATPVTVEPDNSTIESTKSTNSKPIKPETSIFTIRTMDSGSKTSMSHMNEIEPGVGAILIEGSIDWVDPKSKRDVKDYDEVDLGSLGSDGDIFSLLQNSEAGNGPKSRLKALSNEILMKRELMEEKERRKQRAYDKKNPPSEIIENENDKIKEEKNKKKNDEDSKQQLPLGKDDNEQKEKKKNRFLNDPIGRNGIVVQGKSMNPTLNDKVAKSPNNIQSLSDSENNFKNENDGNLRICNDSSNSLLTAEQEKNLPNLSDDEFIAWMNEFVAASHVKVDRDKDMVENIVNKQLAKRHALQGSLFKGLSGLSGISITPTAGSATSDHHLITGSHQSVGGARQEASSSGGGLVMTLGMPSSTSGSLTPFLGVAGSTPFSSRPETRGALPEIQFGRGTGVKIVRSEDGGYSYDYFEPPATSSLVQSIHSSFEDHSSTLEKPQGWMSPAVARWRKAATQSYTADVEGAHEGLLTSASAPVSFELKGEAFKLPDINDVKAATLSWSDNVPTVVAGLSAQEKEKAWTDFQGLGMSEVVALAYEELAKPVPTDTFLTTSSSNVEPTLEKHEIKTDQSPALILPSITKLQHRVTHQVQKEEEIQEEDDETRVEAGDELSSTREQAEVEEEIEEEEGLNVNPSIELTEPDTYKYVAEIEDEEENEDENEALIASALRSIVSELHGEDAFWKSEDVSHTSNTSATRKQLFKKHLHRNSTTAILNQKLLPSKPLTQFYETSSSPLPTMVAGNTMNISGVRRMNQARPSQFKERVIRTKNFTDSKTKRNSSSSQGVQYLRKKSLVTSKKDSSKNSPSMNLIGGTHGNLRDHSLEESEWKLGSTSSLFEIDLSTENMSLRPAPASPQTPMPVYGLFNRSTSSTNSRSDHGTQQYQATITTVVPIPEPRAPPSSTLKPSIDNSETLPTQTTSSTTAAVQDQLTEDGLIDIPVYSEKESEKKLKTTPQSKKSIQPEGKKETTNLKPASVKSNKNKKTKKKKSVNESKGKGDEEDEEDDDDEEDDEDEQRSITLDSITNATITDQPVVHIRNVKKIDSKSKTVSTAPWSFLSKEDLNKSQKMERAMAKTKQKNTDEDDDFRGEAFYDSSKLDEEFDRRRRKGQMGV